MRVFSISDIHADYGENLKWVIGLSDQDFTADVLLLAGDISHRVPLVEEVLTRLRHKFGALFFVPGNHDLWIRGGDEVDSLERFRRLRALCDDLEVTTEPRRLGPAGEGRWIVPLFSWYERPEESARSLFLPKERKYMPGGELVEDETDSLWVDNWAVRWPDFGGAITACDYFLGLNEPYLGLDWDAPVLSFSHFLPRKELIPPSAAELEAWEGPLVDPLPQFNFSRVAGSTGLDRQVRALGATVHVYGHQHRNRQLELEGVRYLSHCLGYPRERASGRLAGAFDEGPRLIWEG